MIVLAASVHESGDGDLPTETLYRWAREKLQTGKWSYNDGIVGMRGRLDQPPQAGPV